MRESKSPQVLSEKQIAANRQNAKKSTGPRTISGKQRASRNSFRHGLSLTPVHDPQDEEAIREFVSNLVGGYACSQGELIDAARLLAEAEARLARVRHAKRDVLSSILIGNSVQGGGYVLRSPDLLDPMRRLDRYEQQSRRRRDRAVRQWLLKIERCRRKKNEAVGIAN